MYQHLVPSHLWAKFLRACLRYNVKPVFYRDRYNMVIINKIHQFDEIMVSLVKEDKEK